MSTSTQHVVTSVEAEDIARFTALNARLSQNALDSYSLGFRGWDKFKRSEFRYGLYHLAPPPRLQILGSNRTALNSPVMIAFGGTVSPTADGFQLAELLSQEASARYGATIVAGGVIGIDMAAHLGALDAGRPTIAVLANPVSLGLHPYTPKRTFMSDGILAHGGLLVSEYESASDDINERLLQRDRVVTALSDSFVAVECSRNSATVDAAKRAKLQGKRVLAVNWSNIQTKWHEPKTSGGAQLLDECIAEPLPSQSVTSISDPRLVREFHELLAV